MVATNSIRIHVYSRVRWKLCWLIIIPVVLFTGVADSASCVFISPDDRFVAVGFTNSFDNNANFIVFDLFNKAGVIDSPIVALNADPHCTVILNHDEALTGTRNGELVIWSMKTGKAQVCVTVCKPVCEKRV